MRQEDIRYEKVTRRNKQVICEDMKCERVRYKKEISEDITHVIVKETVSM